MYIAIGNSVGSSSNFPSGGVTPFENEYSLEFDGVNDGVQLGETTTSLGLSTAISVSIWAKMPEGTVTFKSLIAEDNTGGTTRNWSLIIVTNKIYWSIWNADGSAKSAIDPTTERIQDGEWHHIMGTYDGTSNADGLKLWVDGVNVVSATATSTGIRTAAVTTWIGAIASAGTAWNWEGHLDEASTWSEVKVPDDVRDSETSKPIDLSGKSGLHSWTRMGDGATWNGTNWLLPNAKNSALFSQKSFVFDGVNEYITISSLATSGDDLAISFWGKLPNLSSGASYIIAGDSNNYIYYNSNEIMYAKINGSTAYIITNAGGVPNVFDGNWHYFVVSKVGSTVTFWFDGVSYANAGTGTTGGFTTTHIGAYTTGASGVNGNLDDVAIFEADKTGSINTFYNSGVPTDLSGESGLVGYWIFDDATFSTNWTVPDNSTNSNDGTSANMEEVDSVLDTPTNLYSAVSQNMDEADRVEDTP
jgi:hypothetical protein